LKDADTLSLPKISHSRIRVVTENQRIIALDARDPPFALQRLSPTCSNLGVGLRLRSFLRHQLNIALRQRPARLPLRGIDRALLV